MRLASYNRKAIVLVIYNSNHSMTWICACWNVLSFDSCHIKAFDEFKSVRIRIEPSLIDTFRSPNSSSFESELHIF